MMETCPGSTPAATATACRNWASTSRNWASVSGRVTLTRTAFVYVHWYPTSQMQLNLLTLPCTELVCAGQGSRSPEVWQKALAGQGWQSVRACSPVDAE